MTIHRIIYDVAKKTSTKIELTSEEEMELRAQWTKNEAAQIEWIKNLPLTFEVRIAALEVIVKLLQDKQNI